MTKFFIAFAFLLNTSVCCLGISPADAQDSLTILHSFSALQSPASSNADGAFPSSPLVIDATGNLFGTAPFGGSNGGGTIFSITSGGVFATLVNFDGSDGATPLSVVIGSDGSLYGTTANGGADNAGTVFRCSKTGVVTLLHSFPSLGAYPFINAGGSMPQPGLLQGADGNFYGTTSFGGTSGNGVVYTITPEGAFTALVSFDSTSGVRPYSGLVQGSDGKLYGTTSGGGNHGGGTVYTVTTSGELTVLYNFGTTATDGIYPWAGLIEGADGNFYGTTSSGGKGVEPDGTVFKITPSGVLTTLADFSGKNGSRPLGNLLQASDDNFYGTTADGGSNNGGTLFKVTHGGALVIVYNFTASSSSTTPPYTSDGASSPFAGLVQGTDGTLYGMTKHGSPTGNGTVYKAIVNLASPTLTPQSIAALPDGGSCLLWNQGDGTAVVWTLDALGTKTEVGSTFGPYAQSLGVWKATAIKAASDGSTRVLWDRSDGAAGVWTLTANGNLQTVGPTYGPFTDSRGAWNATGLGVAPDGTSRLLWNRSDGAAGVWTLNPADAVMVIGPAYGPYDGVAGGWIAQSICAVSDGTSRILWTQSTGAAGLWALDAQDVLETIGPTYGPFGNSQTGMWSASDIGASSDGTARVLWNRTDGAAGIWSFDRKGNATEIGPAYGPFADASGVWNAVGIATISSGVSQVAWERTDGAAGIWFFTSANAAAAAGRVYGPY